MRDFRDAKAMAQTLRAALAAKATKISIGESLELTARMLGSADWNTLSATIKADEAKPAPPPPPAPTPPTAQALRPSAKVQRFSAGLERTLHQAVALANQRKHQYTTLEHLLLALADDEDASLVLEACDVDLAELRMVLTAHVDGALGSLVTADGESAGPTAGFHRVVQRAVIHVQASGVSQVTGANLLVALFSERESHACVFLEERRMTRVDAVNFIVHGIRKDGAAP